MVVLALEEIAPPIPSTELSDNVLLLMVMVPLEARMAPPSGDAERSEYVVKRTELPDNVVPVMVVMVELPLE